MALEVIKEPRILELHTYRPPVLEPSFQEAAYPEDACFQATFPGTRARGPCSSKSRRGYSAPKKEPDILILHAPPKLL